MLLYILKSSFCLFILLAFYKLLLEQTSYHQFKRFYLLATMLLSIGIPLITLTIYVEPEYILGSFNNPIDNALLNAAPQEQVETKTNYWPILLWSFYALGILVFLIKFSSNIIKIIKKIYANPKFKNKNFINVLLKELTVPHTFFKYVFVNKDTFENNQIPKEVLDHEAAHAQQKHTLDVIAAELFQVVFWFNPLVYILKKDIKLNHEFLADAAVLHLGSNRHDYKNLLLNYSLNKETCHLTHAINYSSIKKRLTVMNTQTSKTSFWIRNLLLIPILIFMVYGFSSKKEVPKYVEPKINIEQQNVVEKVKQELITNNAYKITYSSVDSLDIKQLEATEKQLAEYNRLAKHYNAMIKRGSNITIRFKDLKRIEKLYSIMSRKQRKQAEPFPDFPEPPPPPKVPEAPGFSKKEVEVPVSPKPIKNYGEDEEIELPAPPPPPAPKDLPTMEELAKKGAVFYLEGNKITSKEAIEYVNNNKKINIQITDVNTKKPVVKLSKKPIIYKTKN